MDSWRPEHGSFEIGQEERKGREGRREDDGNLNAGRRFWGEAGK